MTAMHIQPIIDLIEDLNRDLTTQQRYQRVVQAIHHAIPCDAVALLQLEQNALHPLAVIGLRHEAIGRHFDLHHHPRLAAILRSEEPTRFEADSPLPDPYDGLVEAEQHQLEVHDCLGSPIYIDGELWGALTLDALQPGTFDDLPWTELRGFIAAAAATIKTSLHINALRQRAEQSAAIAQRLMETDSAPELLGRSPAMHAMQEEIRTVAPSDLSVLITGETGVGKDLVARAIHYNSRRAGQALVQVNCAALPESVVESELFGHLRGAFTGASRDRSGRFELADGGSLYLDEIGELPLGVQAKLLRALQSGEIQRVGSDNTLSVDVRIIAATNRDLEKEVQAGRFRADLYHRLSVYPLPVPPLRERQRDVEILAGHFLEQLQHRLGIQRLRLNPAATAQLQAYDWPGNVRELEHLLSRAALKARREGGNASAVTISPAQLELPQTTAAATSPAPEPAVADIDGPGLRERTDHFQRQLIEHELLRQQGNLAATARALQVDRSNLARSMRRLGLS
ncbi:nitric oxide reductase transcriptional regulator NorR [Parahaliea aestuarii]|uniref:Nitric oxide reductase transcriptional regulator NorR n=1 Tax=Parahaliea aestuarii TaxID=1852021 RepID=A0A5C9A0V6_9GAMM|nr:nitric oxide reductase transcriptional regulator NorR [Parahaliea aestuarii]TXS94505.1 nitric oxide reductase transcriptional regulator NorR [Parahaliea aestuarii]